MNLLVHAMYLSRVRKMPQEWHRRKTRPVDLSEKLIGCALRSADVDFRPRLQGPLEWTSQAH